MKKTTITTSVINGRFKRNRKIVLGLIKSFEGKNLILTFDKEIKKRSNPQNQYYWGVIVPLIQEAILTEWGEINSKEEVHELLKFNCNYIEKVNEETGEILRISKSTTENTTTQQEDFHSNCRKLAKDYFNIDIPLPNEDLKLEFNN